MFAKEYDPTKRNTYGFCAPLYGHCGQTHWSSIVHLRHTKVYDPTKRYTYGFCAPLYGPCGQFHWSSMVHLRHIKLKHEGGANCSNSFWCNWFIFTSNFLLLKRLCPHRNYLAVHGSSKQIYLKWLDAANNTHYIHIHGCKRLKTPRHGLVQYQMSNKPLLWMNDQVSRPVECHALNKMLKYELYKSPHSYYNRYTCMCYVLQIMFAWCTEIIMGT